MHAEPAQKEIAAPVLTGLVAPMSRRMFWTGSAVTGRLLTLLQVAPLASVLIGFLLLPMVALVVVSFFDYNSVQIIPAF